MLLPLHLNLQRLGIGEDSIDGLRIYQDDRKLDLEKRLLREDEEILIVIKGFVICQQKIV